MQGYEQLIIEGIKGLSQELLAEIAHFVYFTRKRATEPQAFEDELQSTLLGLELKRLKQAEIAHLEQEFENYDQRYPRE